MWSERSITACTGNMLDICTYIFLHNSISADSYSKKHSDDSHYSEEPRRLALERELELELGELASAMLVVFLLSGRA